MDFPKSKYPLPQQEVPETNCSLIWQEWIIVMGWTMIGVFLAIRAKRIYRDEFCSGMGNDL